MAAKKDTNRKAILQALWKKAFVQDQLAIPVPTKSDASKLRFDLYACVKACKEDPSLDMDLSEAANGCMVTIVSDKIVVIKRRMAEHFLIEAALVAGIDTDNVQESPKNQEELRAQESLKRLGMAINEGGLPAPAMQPQHRPNPFFDRTQD